MIEEQVQGVEFICVSISPQRSRASKAPTRLMIGNDPRGLSTGGICEIARQAVARHRQALAELLQGTDMVFIAAGMGGGTGTGATPMILKTAVRITRSNGATEKSRPCIKRVFLQKGEFLK